jgi:hypothetical protein
MAATLVAAFGSRYRDLGQATFDFDVGDSISEKDLGQHRAKVDVG